MRRKRNKKPSIEDRIRTLIDIKEIVIEGLRDLPNSQRDEVNQVEEAFSKLIDHMRSYYDEVDRSWKSKLDQFLKE